MEKHEHTRSPGLALATCGRGAAAFHTVSDSGAAGGLAGAGLSAALHAHAARAGGAAGCGAGALSRPRRRLPRYLARASALSVLPGWRDGRPALRRQSGVSAPPERPATHAGVSGHRCDVRLAVWFELARHAWLERLRAV